ncbi:peroxiredoxin [Rhodovulum iodosum]|uniref:Glutathione-dependent peroxiredoxin n=1 Tax=Rhodovulum iodosum TaxID=68291 RepID=A0ABV3XQA0_9RHOB|nr:peroxiredoxin [Rhodovulum robiginosum]RSK39425.1 peroxiredoxin [Rhodovulum robiginosum]
MTISKGDRLPDVTMTRVGVEGPETVQLAEVLKGRKVVVFGLPGAFTRGCTSAHLPSFIRTADAFRGKGVDEIVCIAVNDPFALNAWAEATGGKAAGISFLGDSEGKLTHALGMEFSAPAIGLIGRSNRYAALVEDGVVTVAQVDAPGECNLSTGEELLAAI